MSSFTVEKSICQGFLKFKVETDRMPFLKKGSEPTIVYNQNRCTDDLSPRGLKMQVLLDRFKSIHNVIFKEYEMVLFMDNKDLENETLWSQIISFVDEIDREDAKPDVLLKKLPGTCEEAREFAIEMNAIVDEAVRFLNRGEDSPVNMRTDKYTTLYCKIDRLRNFLFKSHSDIASYNYFLESIQRKTINSAIETLALGKSIKNVRSINVLGDETVTVVWKILPKISNQSGSTGCYLVYSGHEHLEFIDGDIDAYLLDVHNRIVDSEERGIARKLIVELEGAIKLQEYANYSRKQLHKPTENNG